MPVLQVNLENVGAYICIATFLMGAMRVIVISPMKECITKLERTLTKMDERLDAHEVAIARMSESTKSAHKRIDRIEKEVV